MGLSLHAMGYAQQGEKELAFSRTLLQREKTPDGSCSPLLERHKEGSIPGNSIAVDVLTASHIRFLDALPQFLSTHIEYLKAEVAGCRKIEFEMDSA